MSRLTKPPRQKCQPCLPIHSLNLIYSLTPHSFLIHLSLFIHSLTPHLLPHSLSSFTQAHSSHSSHSLANSFFLFTRSFIHRIHSQIHTSHSLATSYSTFTGKFIRLVHSRLYALALHSLANSFVSFTRSFITTFTCKFISRLYTLQLHLGIMELFIRETSLLRNEHLGICTLLPYKLSSL